MRDRAILLILLDTGLRVSEAAGIRVGDLRPDGSVKVMGKGAKERIVPIGSTARGAIVRYLAQNGPRSADAPLFLVRNGHLTHLDGGPPTTAACSDGGSRAIHRCSMRSSKVQESHLGSQDHRVLWSCQP